MKIAVILNSFPTVSETFILAQLVGLFERGHEVDIYADRPVPPPQKIHDDVERLRLIERTRYRVVPPAAKLNRLQSAASGIIRWGWRRPWAVVDSLNVFRYGRRAWNLSLVHEWFGARPVEKDYDIIHCHFGPNGQRAFEMRRAGMLRGKIITTFHGYDANVIPKLQGPKCYKELFQHGDLFTVGSEFMRQRIISLGAPAQRIVTLPMGVDLTRHKFAERQQSESGEVRLLTVARLVEVKGIAFALRAVATLKDKYPYLRYTIAGDGPLRSRLEGLTVELGLTRVVQFLGAVSQDEAANLYKSAQGFILPCIVTDSGEEEGQSVVLAEAQAMGLPVIATSVGGIPESLREGESGLLVPPRDVEALATAIRWFLDHPEEWSRMGRAGRQHVEQKFYLEKLHDQLVDTYRILLSRHHSKPHNSQHI